MHANDGGPGAASRALASLLVCTLVSAQPRLYAALPSPQRHPLYARHHTKAPELALFSPANCSLFCPSFAAIRGFNMIAPQTWQPTLDLFVSQLQLCDMVWPDFRTVIAPNWPDLAAILANQSIAVTDVGGFVPGGTQDFDVHTAAGFQPGVAALGPQFLGMDMGEQDVRYLWGYAGHVVLPGPSQRVEQALRFRDFAWNIEWKMNGSLAALASSVYGVHHWLHSGMYTLAGAETSQSNGNAQVLYAFVRGAGKQYGVLWYGQVSVFNWFGYKVPGDLDPSPSCTSQSDHSPTCGTSLNLMKRLMYTQLAYDSAYFAFEGGWVLPPNDTSISSIGLLQRAARNFSLMQGTGAGMGVHVPSVAIMLDFFGGWTRPCDSAPQQYTAATWGNLPWDAADFLADAVMDTVWPGYRAGSLMHNETGTMSPTPFGDAADVLLSDALPSVMSAYDTLIMAHRIQTDGADVLLRVSTFVASGGRVVVTASTLADMQAAAGNGSSLGGVSVGACMQVPAGTRVIIPGQDDVVESLPFTACNISTPADSSTVLASISSMPVAVRVAVGNGSLTVLAAGDYGMTPNGTTGQYYSCGVDEIDTRTAQPYAMVAFVRAFMDAALSAAAIFDLGPALAWVPKRVRDGEYTLTVTNPSLEELPLNITCKLGPIAWVDELPLDGSEKSAVGYLPHGYEGVNVGNSTNTTIAGGDTRVFRVGLVSDSSTIAPGGAGPLPPPLPASAAWPLRRLLRLQPGTGDVRRALLSRPSFDTSFAGIVLDWQYVWSRSPAALAVEARWFTLHDLSIIVDFTSATDLFPGIRLCDDMGGYYAESMAIIGDVFSKLPIIGSHDVMLTLHGISELPPANFSSNPLQSTIASVQATLAQLAAQAAGVNATLHLRRTLRNEKLAGPGLSSQAAFAAAAGVRIAPSLAYAVVRGDSVADMVALVASGNASIVLLSSAWSGAAGRTVEGAPLAALDASQQSNLQTLHAAAVAAGAWVVMDAGYDTAEAGGRAQELADVAFLVGTVTQGA